MMQRHKTIFITVTIILLTSVIMFHPPFTISNGNKESNCLTVVNSTISASVNDNVISYNNINSNVNYNNTQLNLKRGVVMTCPTGKAAHNSGTWKPVKMTNGIKALQHFLSREKSSIPIYMMNRHSDTASQSWCENFKNNQKPGSFFCHVIKPGFPEFYGSAKIPAIMQAPVDELLWLDCDAFLSEIPEKIFGIPEYAYTGAVFWPDIEGHYDLPASLYEKYNIKIEDNNNDNSDSWKQRQGFDSGIIVINKKKHEKALNFLNDMGRDISSWQKYSSGDKDLWHLAWELTNSPYTYVPYVGALGSFGKNGNWLFASQAKYDTSGHAVAFHQIWKDDKYPCSETLFPILFVDSSISGLSDFRCPLHHIKFHLKKHKNYKFNNPWSKFLEEMKFSDEFSFTNFEVLKMFTEVFQTWKES